VGRLDLLPLQGAVAVAVVLVFVVAHLHKCLFHTILLLEQVAGLAILNQETVAVQVAVVVVGMGVLAALAQAVMFLDILERLEAHWFRRGGLKQPQVTTVQHHQVMAQTVATDG
jgi:hypothetical protein